MDIMNFLSIDCSTDIGSLFVKTKNKTFSKILQSDKFNNDLLMKQILDFFSENNIEFKDLSMILVNQGPGNFSGLRGSLATAKGISLSKNIKLFGYNKFIWSCTKFINQKGAVYSIIKFREKYFIKTFNENLQSVSEPQEISANEIIEKYDDGFKVIVKSDIKYFDKRILELNNINIVNLDLDKLELLQTNGLLNEDFVKPIYLS